MEDIQSEMEDMSASRRPDSPRIRGTAWTAALACLSVCAAAAPRAESGPSGPYALGLRDIPLAALSAAVGLSGELRHRNMDPVDTAALDRGKDLWALDRWAAGNYSPGAALTSDLLVAPMVAAPVLAAAWEAAGGREDWQAAGAEALVFAEALGLSSGLVLWARSFRVHPRPLVYASGAPARDRVDSDASGSFYSGHANAAFLAATFFSCTWSLRHPGDASNAWVWGGSLAAAAGVAGLRIAAGKHYLSDVVVGAVAGAGFGLLFPWLHRRPENRQRFSVSLGPASPPVLVLAWRF
jgi:membrane-associated phospholipid phosphatase